MSNLPHQENRTESVPRISHQMIMSTETHDWIGWHPPGKFYRWAGADGVASVELPLAQQDLILTFNIIRASELNLIDQLRIFLDDQPLSLRYTYDGAVEAEVGVDMLANDQDYNTLRFEYDQIYPIAEFNPEIRGSNIRTGFGLRSIEVEPNLVNNRETPKTESGKLDVFVHLPKTGGSTIRGLIAQNYDTARTHHFIFRRVRRHAVHYLEFPEDRKRELDLIHGHFPYGAHRFFPKECRYFTLLRNPVDRILSAYYFIYNFKDHPLHKKATEGQLSLDSMLNEHLTPDLDNAMAKFLSGNSVFVESEERYAEEAIANLTDRFAVFGLTERFNESILFIAKTLGWKPPVYVSKNVANNYNRNEISEETIEFIKTHDKVRLDHMVYEYAVKLFDERTAREPDVFLDAKEELNQLVEELNRDYDHEKHRIYTVEDGVDQELWQEIPTPKMNSYLGH